jgi:hypothetical protein
MRMRILFFALCMVPLLPARAATYYVDAEHGNDSNNGNSPTAAWKSINKLGQQKLLHGDTILLRRGQIWREQLNLQSSGEAQRPITIDAYGEGSLPEISGADVVPPEGWTACQSCGANIWQSNVTVQPNVIVLDGIKATKRPTSADVKSAGDWNWSNGTLYIYAADQPARAFPKRGVEIGARPIGINLTPLRTR